MVDAADDRHVRGHRCGPGARLVAEQFEGLHSRTDECHASPGAAPGEVRVLRQEAVARVQRVAARVHGGGDDLFDVEVRRRPGAVEGHRLVRLAGVQGSGVVRRRHRHRRHAELRRRAHDADRDLAAVRHQELHAFIPRMERSRPLGALPRNRVWQGAGTGQARPLRLDCYHVSTLGRFFSVRGAGLGMLSRPCAIQARVSAGSMTSSMP